MPAQLTRSAIQNRKTAVLQSTAAAGSQYFFMKARKFISIRSSLFLRTIKAPLRSICPVMRIQCHADGVSCRFHFIRIQVLSEGNRRYFFPAGFGICSQWHMNTACSFRSMLRRNTSSFMFSTMKRDVDQLSISSRAAECCSSN